MATTLEERLTEVEARLDALQRLLDDRATPSAPLAAQTSRGSGKRGWRAIVGTFADDPLYDEAMRLGREWRDAQKDGATESAETRV